MKEKLDDEFKKMLLKVSRTIRDHQRGSTLKGKIDLCHEIHAALICFDLLLTEYINVLTGFENLKRKK